MYQRKNFAYGIVATAPSPAASGTSLVLTAGEGARFPNTTGGTYVCVVKAPGVPATPDNAEVVLVTTHDPAGDTFTITRTQESSGARTVLAGDEFYLSPTDGVWDQIDVLTTKGDILTFSTVYARLGVGTDGQILESRASETTGLKWITPPAYAPTANPTFTGTVILPKAIEIQDTSADHQYVLAVSELTADRTVTLPLLTAADEFVFKNHTQDLVGKTLISPLFQGTIDGWIGILSTITFTYASATTINVSSGAALIFKIGDKIRYQNNDSGTWLYDYIVGVADTLLTVAGDAVPNATLTDNYYSHQSNPIGFPATFAYTPTYTGFSANPSLGAKYHIEGRLVTITLIELSAGTSNASGFTMTVPGTCTAYSQGIIRVNNNGTYAAGYYQVDPSGSTCAFNSTLVSSSTFVTSGSKSATGWIQYLI